MKILLALLLAATAHAGPLINGNQINPQTKISIATLTVTGAGDTSIANSLTASSMTASGAGFKGAGTGLTGTAAALSIGGTASALTAAGSAAPSGFVCRGVDASGNCLPAATDATTAGVSGSTLPWQSAAAFTALPLKANLNGATFTGASGITNQSFTATGANGNIVGSSSFTTTGGGFFGSLRDSAIATGTQCLHADSSGNITGTGSDCLASGTFGQLASTQTWSGTNTFQGAVVFSSNVAVSTCTGDISGTGSFVTPTGNVYTHAVATVTYTPDGFNPFKVCYHGAIDETGSGGQTGWSFLVDGSSQAALVGLSYTKGVTDETSFTVSGQDTHMGDCYIVQPGWLTKVAHTFGVTMSGNAGNTVQAGGHVGSSMANFCVESMH